MAVVNSVISGPMICVVFATPLPGLSGRVIVVCCPVGPCPGEGEREGGGLWEVPEQFHLVFCRFFHLSP